MCFLFAAPLKATAHWCCTSACRVNGGRQGKLLFGEEVVEYLFTSFLQTFPWTRSKQGTVLLHWLTNDMARFRRDCASCDLRWQFIPHVRSVGLALSYCLLGGSRMQIQCDEQHNQNALFLTFTALINARNSNE